MRAWVVVLVALALALGASGTAGGESSATTAVVDRTLSCPLTTAAGFRLLGVSGNQGLVGYESGASAFVSDQLAAGDLKTLVHAHGIGITLQRGCVAAKRIALTRKALPGPPDAWQSSYDCELTPKRVLVRIRATVAKATPWKRLGPRLILERAVSKAEIAVQTPTRKPIAFVSISGKKLRLWVSPGCVRD
jgi:hypothetical protein